MKSKRKRIQIAEKTASSNPYKAHLLTHARTKQLIRVSPGLISHSSVRHINF